jgi:hypothetical protein|tara:strand:+ start:3467 stop:3736 length:270 start_codon:yes stop_codon:yes gene_type:complete
MTMFFLGRDFLQEIEDDAAAMLGLLEDEAVDAMINSKGLAYGDVELNPTQRMMKFVDDEQSGVNANLSPETRARRSAQFRGDVENSGAI